MKGCLYWVVLFVVVLAAVAAIGLTQSYLGSR